MIKEEEVWINGHSSNYLYYRGIGYDVYIRKPFLVKTKDLMRGSAVKVTTICSICDGESTNAFKDYFNYTNGFKDPFFCNKCKSAKSEKTCIDRYGFKNPMQSEVVKELLKDSLKNKYGVDHYSKTDEYKYKYKKTCIEKYGVDNPFKSDVIKAKIKLTMNENFKVDYPMQSEVIRDKSKDSCMGKYGVDCYSKTDEYLEKVSKTNIENYGVPNVMQSDIIKSKSKETNIERYGVDSISKTSEFKSNIKNKRERFTLNRFINLLIDDYDVLSYSNDEFLMRHKFCGKEFKTHKGLVISRKRIGVCICIECNPIGVQYSSIESEICSFLDDNNIDYLKGDRSVLSGKELDIYIPGLGVAIEVNGVFWHSELYKPNRYHIDKTSKCMETNIDLLHVWEDDWKNKSDIVKSIISNRVGICCYKIFARKCKLNIVSSSDARLFLDNNHIQGFSSSSTRLGLYYNDILVSLMTFGYRYTNGKKEFELIRFCNKINYSVIGGASKLFKYFIKNNKDSYIISSYADISLFSGHLYEKLGFEKSSLSKPNYFWVINGVRKHRFNFNKNKLIKEGFDPNKTEVEIMHERGYYRIFSCGHQKWVYINNI